MSTDPTKFCARCQGTTNVHPRKVAGKTILLCRACRAVLKALRRSMGDSCPF